MRGAAWRRRGILTDQILRVFFVCMATPLKTVSVDLEAFRLLRKAKGARESYGDVVRRIFAAHAEEVDLEAYLTDLERNPPAVDTALLRRRQQQPRRSPRPARRAV